MCLHTEFKEIRREWKQRKKEEEAARKAAEEERQRQAAAAAAAAAQAQQNGTADPSAQPGTEATQPPPTTYAASRPVQLPPIGYSTTQYPAPPSTAMPQSLPDYSGGVYNYGSPASPYGQQNQQIYSQRKSGWER